MQKRTQSWTSIQNPFRLFTQDRLRMVGVVTAVMLGVTACSDDDDNDPVVDADFDFTSILADFSEYVSIQTYADLKSEAAAMHTATIALAADPTNQSLVDAAAQAWVDTRHPWESSEAFLFGPAEQQSLDPSLDSWPVDRQQLNDVLSSPFELNADSLVEDLGPAVRGFHTVEYLLFREGNPRTAADMTAREVEYLVAAAEVLANDTALLHDSWEETFGQEFATAGEAGSRYVTQRSAAQEIIEGMIGICDEVANGKIADPFDEQNTELVESQFSYNSIVDFQDNIRSVQAAYVGGYLDGTDGTGIDSFVNSEDPALNIRVKAEILAAIAAIAAIPEPFRDNLDENTLIETAQQAITKVINTLELDVKPLVVN